MDLLNCMMRLRRPHVHLIEAPVRLVVWTQPLDLSPKDPRPRNHPSSASVNAIYGVWVVLCFSCITFMVGVGVAGPSVGTAFRASAASVYESVKLPLGDWDTPGKFTLVRDRPFAAPGVHVHTLRVTPFQPQHCHVCRIEVRGQLDPMQYNFIRSTRPA